MTGDSQWLRKLRDLEGRADARAGGCTGCGARATAAPAPAAAAVGVSVVIAVVAAAVATSPGRAAAADHGGWRRGAARRLPGSADGWIVGAWRTARGFRTVGGRTRARGGGGPHDAGTCGNTSSADARGRVRRSLQRNSNTNSSAGWTNASGRCNGGTGRRPDGRVDGRVVTSGRDPRETGGAQGKARHIIQAALRDGAVATTPTSTGASGAATV